MPAPVTLLNLSQLPVIANRDGQTGPYARLYLPFSPNGYFFFSGQILTFPCGTIPQNTEYSFTGTKKPNTFQKDCCTCG